MMYQIAITGQAYLDMKVIVAYIAGVLMEASLAEKLYSRIEKSINSLDQMPERFRRYEKEPWRSRNLHIMPIDNYIVLYIVDNEPRTVTVIRVMYAKRNIEKELDDMAQQEK